ncbi:ABC transporter permease [Nocardioidaceae bacterium SCSIO 66511]|nr:ABC transporter permease [Nocardioidaceae bacterium SCSIO 66511]
MSIAIDPAERRRQRVASIAQKQGAFVVLALLLVIGSLTFDTFATRYSLTNIVVEQSFLAIVALGMTFVILTGGIDLSVGSVFALGGVLAAYGSEYGFLGALLLPVVVCGAIGALQGFCIAYGRMAPFIVTLAGLLGVRGLVFAITDEGAVTPDVESDAFVSLGQDGPLGFTWSVVLMIVAYAVAAVILHRTSAGQSALAIGGSEDAANLMGLPVPRIKLTVYLMSGVLAGLAGALNAARSSSGVTTVGVGMELEAIAAVVIGGTLLTGGRGGIAGTLAGVLLLGVIQKYINLIGDLSSSYQNVVSGLFLLAVVVVQTYLSRNRDP